MAKILVVDDEVRVRELVRKALDREGYEVVTVPTPEQALELVSRELFSLVLLDVRLSVHESGISLLKKIRERQKEVPVVILSGALTPEIEREAKAAGASAVLGKDIDILSLVARLGEIIIARGQLPASDPVREPSAPRKIKTVLVVDDEAGVRHVVKEFFRRKGYRVLEAGTGADAIKLCETEKVSVALLDVRMPGMDGLAVLRELRRLHPGLGVVMTTGVQDDEEVAKALALGAYGYVLKPFDFLYLELVVMSKLGIAED